MEEWIVQVDPIIIYPDCYKAGRKQDCFNCELSRKKACDSPRGLCVREYHNHKKGCPNYNKKNGCPPNLPMLDEVYDLSKPIYAIYNIFDFKGHVDRMKERHPHWSKRQLENCLYWQGSARKKLKERIKIVEGIFIDCTAILCPEGMGVQVTETMKKVGIELEWPPYSVTYQIALAGLKRK